MRRLVRVPGAGRVPSVRQVQRRAHTRVALRRQRLAAHRRRPQADHPQPAAQGPPGQQGLHLLRQRQRRQGQTGRTGNAQDEKMGTSSSILSTTNKQIQLPTTLPIISMLSNRP